MADLTQSRPSAPPVPSIRLICKVCTRNFSQYTCPRCNIRYCSLQCYKKHSVRCTEQFARENVMEEMRDMNATPESKQKMLEALKRIHFDEEGRSVFEDEFMQDLHGEEEEEEPSGSGLDTDELLSEDTLRRLQEGGGISFEDLSPSEKKAFQRAVAAGELSHMIKPWDPWWTHPLAHTLTLTKSGTQLVQPLDKKASSTRAPPNIQPFDEKTDIQPLDEETFSTSSSIPAPPDAPLQPVKDLTSKQPSPLLGVHLTEVIYGYCFTLRLFNGDWESDPLDAGLVLLEVAKVLGDAGNPESVGGALAECMEAVCSPAFKDAGGYRFGSSLVDDTILLLRLKKEGLICALADTSRLLAQAQKDLKTHTTNSRKQKSKLKEGSSKLKRSSDSRRLQVAQKKVYFMMCWVNEQPSEAFEALVGLVEREKSMLMAVESREHESVLVNSEGGGGGGGGDAARKPVIEELDDVSFNGGDVKEAEKVTSSAKPLIQELD